MIDFLILCLKIGIGVPLIITIIIGMYFFISFIISLPCLFMSIYYERKAHKNECKRKEELLEEIRILDESKNIR